jgi:uncharacterized protein
MKINIAQLKQIIGDCQLFHFNYPATRVCGCDSNWVIGKIVVDGTVVNTGQGLTVSGNIKTVARHCCNRCLEEFESQQDVPFAEIFIETNADELLDISDDGSYFQGDELDILELIRETLVLSEPIKVLCSEDCLGICTQCGIDRNRASCCCNNKVIDPRMAKLQQLLDKNNGF